LKRSTIGGLEMLNNTISIVDIWPDSCIYASMRNYKLSRRCWWWYSCI